MRRLFTALLLACAAVYARGEGPAAATPPSRTSWLETEKALDALIPARKNLADEGVYLGGSFTTDLLGNPVGGKRQGFTYAGLLQIIAVADMGKLAKIPGGYFVMSMSDATGNDLAREYVKSYFHLADASGLLTVALFQMYYEQRLFDEKLTLKAGRTNIGQDFVALDMFALYIGGIDGHPPVLGYNTFWNGIGRSTWSAVVKAEPREDWIFRLGVYQATTTILEAANHGLDMNFSPGDGVQIFAEAEHKTKLRDFWRGGSSELPGTHKLGGYWSSWEYPHFGGGRVPNSYGFYCLGQQMVWREKAATDEGITAWYSFNYAPDTAQALFPFFAGAGAGWQGALANRPEDWLLFGSYYGGISQNFARVQEERGNGSPSYEWVLEADYRAQLTRWLYFMPSAQWVINPRGTGKIPNALVLGAEIGVTF